MKRQIEVLKREVIEVDVKIPSYTRWGEHYHKIFGEGDRDVIQVSDYGDNASISYSYQSSAWREEAKEITEEEFLEAFVRVNGAFINHLTNK